MQIQIQEYEHRLKTEWDLLSYLRLLKACLSQYLVIITVADTGAASYFTPECAQAMMDLGLKVNMLQRYRQPYIAIIDHGNIIHEQYSENLEQPLWVEGKVNYHDIAVYSAGFMWRHGVGSGAMVLIDGANYQLNGRGFNFFVFDTAKDNIIDSCVFDTFAGCSTHINIPISEPLLSFRDRYKDISLCFISFPLPPSKYNLDLTPFEHAIVKDGIKINLWDVLNDKEKMEAIWKSNKLPYCKDYKNGTEFYESFYTPEAFINLDGKRRYVDYTSGAVNTRNGIRITVNQPKQFNRSIFFVGNCRFYGWGATDAYTPASLLQEKLNSNVSDKGLIVHNYSFVGADAITDFLDTLHSLPLRKGDIVFFQDRGTIAPWGIPYCDLRYKSARPHEYGDIFLDDNFHTSHSGNRMIADGIFEFLKRNDFFERNLSSNVGTPIRMNKLELEDENEELHDYKDKLKTFYQRTISPKIGSIVMNCNPFTIGHRYLVDQALKRCDHLIVFVVEEDKSVFPFAERIELVRKNLADLKNVYVIPSGQFIISSRTFKEYFNKESLQEHKIDTSLDVSLFGKEIAPCLNISMRFAGEEPLDNVTRQYNESMARILPQYGVKFIEIPRMKYKGRPVSASEVRRLAEARQFDKLKKLVPPLTLRYLRRKYP